MLFIHGNNAGAAWSALTTPGFLRGG